MGAVGSHSFYGKTKLTCLAEECAVSAWLCLQPSDSSSQSLPASFNHKNNPKPKYIPSPSKTASGTVNAMADAKHTLHFWLDSWASLISELSEVLCVTLQRRDLTTILSIAIHHWHGFCIHIALPICRGLIHVIWQQTEGQHQHLARTSYPYQHYLNRPRSIKPKTVWATDNLRIVLHELDRFMASHCKPFSASPFSMCLGRAIF